MSTIIETSLALSEIHSRTNPDNIRQNIALIQNRQTRITVLTDEIARLEKDPHLYQDAASREASKNSLYGFLWFVAGILAAVATALVATYSLGALGWMGVIVTIGCFKKAMEHSCCCCCPFPVGGGECRTIDDARDDLKSEAQDLRAIKRELELSRNALLIIKSVESARLIGDIEQAIAPIKV